MSDLIVSTIAIHSSHRQLSFSHNLPPAVTIWLQERTHVVTRVLEKDSLSLLASATDILNDNILQIGSIGRQDLKSDGAWFECMDVRFREVLLKPSSGLPRVAGQNSVVTYTTVELAVTWSEKAYLGAQAETKMEAAL